jgi:predicted nucleic acid-binding protein
MLYLDTCVLLAVLLPEGHSERATRFLQDATDPLAISPWTGTEVHSALGVKVRTGSLTLDQADRVLQTFEQELAPALVMLELQPVDFRHADACLRGWTTNLRAADALHLAVAAGRGACLCSLDQPLVQAALQLGLDARLIAD